MQCFALPNPHIRVVVARILSEKGFFKLNEKLRVDALSSYQEVHPKPP
jgi:hypothetical protein